MTSATITAENPGAAKPAGTAGNSGPAGGAVAKNNPRRLRRGQGFLYACWYNFLASLDPVMLAFAIALPISMYFMFGVNTSYSGVNIGNGNVSAHILISMTTYGALLVLNSHGVAVTLERVNGWTRQIAVTSLGVLGWTLSRIVAGLVMSLMVIGICFGVGAAAQAQMDAVTWVQAVFLVWGCAAMSSPFGIAIGYLVRSESAFGIIGAGSSILAFASGMFIPLDNMGKTVQAIAAYTPFYGVARVPVSCLDGFKSLTGWDVGSVIFWLVAFVALAIWASRRRTER